MQCHVASVVDYTEVALLAASGFFAVLSFSLLYRYRQVSQRMTESTDMGRDLWQALEQRMRKQDERILDVMARFDVVQSRVLAAQLQSPPSPKSQDVAPPSPAPRVNQEVERPSREIPQLVESDVTPVTSAPQASREPTPIESPISPERPLDETELSAVRLLSKGDLDTRKITNALGKSREHTARIMKSLFERGLVTRDDSNRPFVYRLTDLGRSRLPPD